MSVLLITGSPLSRMFPGRGQCSGKKEGRKERRDGGGGNGHNREGYLWLLPSDWEPSGVETRAGPPLSLSLGTKKGVGEFP